MLKTQMISGLIEAGCDEAGRGPLAGSVFCAAVILDPLKINEVPEFAWLNDSKQLTEKQREALRPVIEREALSWAVVEVSAKEIDERNILQCSILGMQRALDRLTIRPQHILVDGNKWKPYVPEGELLEIPATTVVHGDATYMSIAAACSQKHIAMTICFACTPSTRSTAGTPIKAILRLSTMPLSANTDQHRTTE